MLELSVDSPGVWEAYLDGQRDRSERLTIKSGLSHEARIEWQTLERNPYHYLRHTCSWFQPSVVNYANLVERKLPTVTDAVYFPNSIILLCNTLTFHIHLQDMQAHCDKNSDRINFVLTKKSTANYLILMDLFYHTAFVYNKETHIVAHVLFNQSQSQYRFVIQSKASELQENDVYQAGLMTKHFLSLQQKYLLALHLDCIADNKYMQERGVRVPYL